MELIGRELEKMVVGKLLSLKTQPAEDSLRSILFSGDEVVKTVLRNQPELNKYFDSDDSSLSNLNKLINLL